MASSPTPVHPLVKHERAFYQAVKQAYTDPWFADLKSRLQSTQTEKAALRIIRLQQARLDRLPNGGAPVGVTVEQLNAIESYHQRRTFQSFRRAVGVSVGPLLSDAPVKSFMSERVRDSVNLIKTIPRRFHAGLAEKITAQLADKPFDQAELRKLLSQEYRSSGYNLRRLTRDQTNKAIGGLTEIRQTQLGVTHYEWNTAGDRRVRPTHADNEGVRFAWAQPPPTGHPGAEVQCRCVAVAVITNETRARLRGEDTAAEIPIEQVTKNIEQARKDYTKAVQTYAPKAEVKALKVKVGEAIARGPVRKSLDGGYKPALSLAKDKALYFDSTFDISKFTVKGAYGQSGTPVLVPGPGAAIPKPVSAPVRLPSAAKPKPAAIRAPEYKPS